jgi:hypothetical protein
MLRCEASLHARNDKDTEYDFVFNLNTRRGCVAASSSTQPWWVIPLSPMKVQRLSGSSAVDGSSTGT